MLSKVLEIIKSPYSFLRRKRSPYLTNRIQEEMRKTSKNSSRFVFGGFFDIFDQLYIPTWKSTGFIASILVYCFLISHYCRGGFLLWCLPCFSKNNLVAIHAGIGTILFALLILVAESLRDDETKDRARVLLRESFLFPLTVAEILVFLFFFWNGANMWSIGLVFCVAIFTIYSLSRLLGILLHPTRFNKQRIKLLTDRMKLSIGEAIKERFGNNLLLQALGENKIELGYYPSSLS